jgi:succinate dehydrogenase/fumarate reductase flavoprotein subunit
MQQPAPVPIYLIFDEKFCKTGSIGESFACWDVSHGNLYDWSEATSAKWKKGWVKRADTVRELASLIDIAPDTLHTSVERYNTFATEGKDIDFNRESDGIAAIRSPPYYAMELTPSFINTQGGPRRDKDARVIGIGGDPIPRLYSAGELGSIYAFNYNAGGNVGECFAFGRIAGRNACKEAPFHA